MSQYIVAICCIYAKPPTTLFIASAFALSDPKLSSAVQHLLSSPPPALVQALHKSHLICKRISHTKLFGFENLERELF